MHWQAENFSLIFFLEKKGSRYYMQQTPLIDLSNLQRLCEVPALEILPLHGIDILSN
jgi:hypothetical protein